MPHDVAPSLMDCSGRDDSRSNRQRIRIMLPALLLFILLAGKMSTSVDAFTARLRSNNTPGGGVPMNLIIIKDKKKKEKHGGKTAAAAESGGDREALEADDEATAEETNNEDWPNADSTFEAAHAFHAAAAASAASEIEHHSTGARMKINGDTTPQAIPDESVPQTIRSCLGPLLTMSRPTNFPGVVVFHILGVHLAISSSAAVSASASVAEALTGKELLLQTLLNPSMMAALASILLVTATSMLVNDYYDARSGVDAANASGLSASADDTKPLATGAVPMIVAKRFISILYFVMLICMAFTPSAPARLAVVLSAALTFWYTQHLKPVTWVKNASVASIIALASFTSGSAALHVLSDPSELGAMGGLGDMISCFGRLVLVIFSGIMAREVLMDVNDCDGDRDAGVVTVPVKHGRRYASWVALGFTALMSTLAVSVPAFSVVDFLDVDGSQSVGAVLANPAVKKLILAMLGSAMQLRRATDVVKTEGNDAEVVDMAIEEGKLSVLFILASFV